MPIGDSGHIVPFFLKEEKLGLQQVDLIIGPEDLDLIHIYQYKPFTGPFSSGKVRTYRNRPIFSNLYRVNKRKLVNDPVYGLIQIPTPLIFDIIEHPLFQRLRRIRQTGLTHLVYPGSQHTRFHHALGAMHLMTMALQELRSKNTAISDDEAEAALIGVLLHDIGHGPYSHALENLIILSNHEAVGHVLMEKLAGELGGNIALALDMFNGNYHRSFFHHLISGQFDLDRLDYLSRDSFYTGVAEGVVGYDRILRMLRVVGDQLVIDEKGLYSIEKFLVARRIMYWQVYLHKTSIAAEGMARKLLALLRTREAHDRADYLAEELEYFLARSVHAADLSKTNNAHWHQFIRLDDVSVDYSIKRLQDHPDIAIRLLAGGLVQRKLFKVKWYPHPVTDDDLEKVKMQCRQEYDLAPGQVEYLVWAGYETNKAYDQMANEIRILSRDGTIRPFSTFAEFSMQGSISEKYYICHPKLRG